MKLLPLGQENTLIRLRISPLVDLQCVYSVSTTISDQIAILRLKNTPLEILVNFNKPPDLGHAATCSELRCFQEGNYTLCATFRPKISAKSRNITVVHFSLGSYMKNQNGKVSELRNDCYFFANKWKFEQMEIWSRIP